MRKILTGCLLTALLVSCSDEDDSVSFKNTSKEKEVESIYELGKCTDDRKGEVIFVENKDEDFICFSGKWIPSSEFDNPSEGDESSSSVKESSSSAKDVSSSDKASSGETSSSDKASSSSEKASSSSGNVSSSGGSSSGETPKSSSSSTSGSSSSKTPETSSSKTPESSSSVKSSSSKTHDSKTFVDTRDGKTYRMVTIGSQTWFAENLNYYGDDVTGFCHSGKPENCDKYGMLYDWDEAKKACPPGTHLPTIEELRKLMDFVGEDSSAVVLMADTGWTRDDGFLGTDEYGFAMLPGSYKAGRSYGSSLGWAGQIWTASDTAGLVYAGYFGWNLPYISIGAYNLEDGWGMSVRCIEGEAKLSSSSSAKSSSSSIKSSSSSQVSSSSSSSEKSSWKFLNPAFSYGEITDSRDGQVYKTIVVDNLTWMAENLNFETSNSYCYNDTAKYCAIYGRMYKWSAALNACPEGWHLPSREEIYALIDLDLNGQVKGADKLRSMVGWIPVNGDDTPGLDAYGFSASPGGRRISSGQYYALGTSGGYWSTTVEEGHEDHAWTVEFHQDDRYSMLTTEYKDWAYSVRCVKGAK